MEPINERLAALEQKIRELDNRTIAMDTQVDAMEQAIAATQAAERMKQRIQKLDSRLTLAIRGFNALACAIAGALLLWFGDVKLSDATPLNDDISRWLMITGGGCVVYSVLVITQQEERLLHFLESINPWRGKGDG